jgi:hypothetical protein
VLLQAAVPRFHAGAGLTPLDAMPLNATVAVGTSAPVTASMCPSASASAGFT